MIEVNKVEVYRRPGLTEEELHFFLQFRLDPLLVMSNVVKMATFMHPKEERMYMIEGNRENFCFQFENRTFYIRVVVPDSDQTDVFKVLIDGEWRFIGSDGCRALTRLSRMYFPLTLTT